MFHYPLAHQKGFENICKYPLCFYPELLRKQLVFLLHLCITLWGLRSNAFFISDLLMQKAGFYGRHVSIYFDLISKFDAGNLLTSALFNV